MHIAKIRQDYYVTPPPPLPAREAAGDRPRSGAAASAGVMPAERVVEGEWQKGRVGDEFFERVWRQRRAEGHGSVGPLPADVRRAIDAYRDQAASSGPRAAAIDYYA